MTAKEKYQAVLDLGEKLEVKDGDVKLEEGQLKVWGTTRTLYEKDLLWDKIKEIGGENPSDIMADIKVENETIYHRHVVKAGETLGKIAKQYYGDPMKYKQIFAANSDILKNPDLIYPDQELIIPKP